MSSRLAGPLNAIHNFETAFTGKQKEFPPSIRHSLARKVYPNCQSSAYSSFRHSGPDPWFDRLTTLSKVEGESIAF
jgi:hypothetical protein